MDWAAQGIINVKEYGRQKCRIGNEPSDRDQLELSKAGERINYLLVAVEAGQA